ncbi:dTDP-4-dehydrorhamnose reductase [Branchiibius sp. NY16-3462-2]|uniref:dTDP-4-dehydrorhamnose reductase n=1 Tax=Branchiibius sp. NY16-3462-2 TaxID=1807500 RepID=UPI000797BCB0|nr:dTDP-4-dehydrorhamnose reductase [Branchiibius sp. NY16-3462-2]KYH45859.1 NAD(P)-dependent oxidoreductase [Branchiibius sp. NY16-3462-2]
MARWLVVGASGMLGTDLVATLKNSTHDVTAWSRGDLDITDHQQVLDRVTGFDVVVNAAAWTAVDAAETHEAEAFAVNAVGAANLATACEVSRRTLVQVSTDYVLDGSARSPAPVDAPVAPRTAYGRTKAAGEWAVRADCERHYVVRTAYLYGVSGPNLVNTMTRLAQERQTIQVVNDQWIQPTWTIDLAQAIVRLVDAEAPYGVWHGTSSGQTTVWEFARAVFKAIGHDPERVLPTALADYPSATPRPAYSVLAHDRWIAAGVPPLPDWDDALARFMAQIDLADAR